MIECSIDSSDNEPGTPKDVVQNIIDDAIDKIGEGKEITKVERLSDEDCQRILEDIRQSIFD